MSFLLVTGKIAVKAARYGRLLECLRRLGNLLAGLTISFYLLEKGSVF
jgi:hypothetical protein